MNLEVRLHFLCTVFMRFCTLYADKKALWIRRVCLPYLSVCSFPPNRRANRAKFGGMDPANLQF